MFSIFSDHPIITSIVVIVTFFILLIIRSYKKDLARLKKWQAGDTLYLSEIYSGSNFYKQAELSSSKFSGSWNKGPLVHLIKWSNQECLVELGNGSEFYIKIDSIKENWSLTNRERDSKMDSFMKDIPSNKQEIRDDKIEDILKS